MSNYYDIGLNLFCKQYKDPKEIVKNAENAGVTCILTGTSTKTNRKIDSFVKENNSYGTVGIHPHNADSARIDDFELIEKIATENEKIIAIGECGLDYDRMYSSRENQIRCFEKQIVLAEKLNMPLFLHERSAVDDFITRFKKHHNMCKKSVVHCFTGDKNTLQKYLDMGFCIGITGWICDDKRGKELREAVRILPLNKVLVETDAPYLLPKNMKGLGGINKPENVIYVIKELARWMDVSEEELIKATKENTEKLFAIK